MVFKRHLGVGIESVYGSSTALDTFLKIESETLKEKVTYDPHDTVAYDSPDQRNIVKRVVEGDITIAPNCEEIGQLLYSLFPNPVGNTFGTSPIAGKHVLDNGSATEGKSLTIGVQRDSSGTNVRASYLGCKVKSCNFSAEVGKPLITKWSIIGKNQGVAASLGSAPTFHTDSRFILTSGSYTINGAANTKVKALSIDVESGINADGDMALGSAQMADLRREGFKVSGNITLTKPDHLIYGTYYLQGTVGNLYCTFRSKTATGSVRTLAFRLPDINWTEGDEGNLTKRELNDAEYSFEANYSTGSAFTMQVMLETDYGTY